MNQDYLYCIEISQSFISDTTEKGIRNDSTRLCVKKPAVLLQRVFFFFFELFCTATFVLLVACQVYVYLSLCLMCQMFWISPWPECQPHEPAKVNR